MPSSVVSCNFGILPILLLTLPVIEELIFRPCSIQGHDIWRQRYKLSLQASLERPRGVTSQPWSQCLECQQLNCYFSVFWLTLGQHSSMCTALSVDLYYCQAVEAYQLCLLNGVCKYCCFCSCLIQAFVPCKSIDLLGSWWVSSKESISLVVNTSINSCIAKLFYKL